MERMQQEAESHAEEDRQAKEEIEPRNEADNLGLSSEKQLKRTRRQAGWRDEAVG